MLVVGSHRNTLPERCCTWLLSPPIKKRCHLFQRKVVPDPLVDPGNPPYRHQAHPAANPARSHYRVVTVAARPSSRSPRRTSQKKYATVMLGSIPPHEPDELALDAHAVGRKDAHL